jgi:hypothetical protein
MFLTSRKSLICQWSIEVQNTIQMHMIRKIQEEDNETSRSEDHHIVGIGTRWNHRIEEGGIKEISCWTSRLKPK